MINKYIDGYKVLEKIVEVEMDRKGFMVGIMF